jgi:hypothetical protein
MTHRTTEHKLDEQPHGKTCEKWGLYQWGLLWEVHRTKRDAIDSAVASSGEPWAKTKAYFRVQRVKVTPL